MKLNITNIEDNKEYNAIAEYINLDGENKMIVKIDKTPTVAKNQLHKLWEYKPGDTVKIGKYEFIVLEHKFESTLLLSKGCVRNMRFDSNSADYAISEIRKWLNTEFYKELSNEVGEESIQSHEVNLTADDGTGKNVFVEDYISLLTAQKYREYRELIEPIGKWWWTSTRINATDDDYARDIGYIRSCGTLNWSDCGSDAGGVRPFCILKSSVEIS